MKTPLLFCLDTLSNFNETIKSAAATTPFDFSRKKLFFEGDRLITNKQAKTIMFEPQKEKLQEIHRRLEQLRGYL
jgi:hypothetical protein